MVLYSNRPEVYCSTMKSVSFKPPHKMKTLVLLKSVRRSIIYLIVHRVTMNIKKKKKIIIIPQTQNLLIKHCYAYDNHQSWFQNCGRPDRNVRKLSSRKPRLCVFTSSVHTDAEHSVEESVFRTHCGFIHIFICSSHTNHV